MGRRKSKAPASPAVLSPRRGCEFCGGTGWAKELTSPARTRDGNRVEYSAPVRRCSCTKPEVRTAEAPEPAPAELDGARRRSGEKEEA